MHPRSQRPLANTGLPSLAAPHLCSPRSENPARSSSPRHRLLLPRRAAGGRGTEEDGQPSQAGGSLRTALHPTARPPSARDEARRARPSQVRIAPSGGTAQRSAHASGSTREEAARARQRLQALSARPAPREGRLESPTRTRSPGRGSSGASSLLSVYLFHRRLPPPPLQGPRASPPPPGPRPPGPGFPGPACALGALMSSTDSLRWLTWCLVRISRPDLNCGGCISPAHPVHPGAAPQEGAERGHRR